MVVRVTMPSYTSNSSGEKITSLEVMKNCAIEFFTSLYNYEGRELLLMDLNISFDDAILPEMVVWLRRYPRIDEIKNVLIAMPKGLALGPDGIIIEILVHHRATIEQDVLIVVLHFLIYKIPLNHKFLSPYFENGLTFNIGGV